MNGKRPKIWDVGDISFRMWVVMVGYASNFTSNGYGKSVSVIINKNNNFFKLLKAEKQSKQTAKAKRRNN